MAPRTKPPSWHDDHDDDDDVHPADDDDAGWDD